VSEGCFIYTLSEHYSREVEAYKNHHTFCDW